MTIRGTLLISYLLISLASALLITFMIFVHFREILQAEIEDKLKSQAATMMQQIDTMLFERMENMFIWNRLDVMQEVKVKDKDKRLSRFLQGLHKGYSGVYQQIFVADLNNEIISASDPKLIGSYYKNNDPWLKANRDNNALFFEKLSADHDRLYFSIAIPDASDKPNIGRLYASFDWKDIFILLEASLPYSSDSLSYALLVDKNGGIIATSSGLENKVFRFYPLPESWQQPDRITGTLNTAAEFLENQEVLVGYASSQGYRTFQGFGWRVLIMQPSISAFAPIGNLWIAILAFLFVTLLIGILVSFWMSAKIARPIVLLAEFTRDFMRGKQTSPPQLKSSREIAELSSQFSRMINNLEQSRQDVVRVAKLAVIGEMAASMAHEVRTPLGILRSSAQILKREPELSEIGHEMTGFILSETKRLNELITTLLECARPRSPYFVKQDFHQILEHTLELLQTQAEHKKVKFIKHFNASNALISCDRDHIIQVFLNLIVNAIQHTTEGGRVELTTRLLDGQMETLVCDDGAGIPDANKARVFDPFFTQRKDGIGLGLTVVQQIILAHHGEIFVTDSDYGGACFNIILPITPIQNN
ncbi:MAG: ATP-binding protein [Methylococcaceae bacterium]